MYQLTCVLCGDQFESSWPQSKMCNKCKHRPCVICGTPLKGTEPPEQRCCCAKCSKEYNRRPEVIAAKEAKRKQTVQERYGVDNVTYLQSTKDKAHATRSAKAEERRKVREAEAAKRRTEKATRKEQERIEKEEQAKRAKLRKCKACGKLFMPTASRNYYCKEDHHATCKVCGSDYIIKYADLPYPRNVCYNSECASEWRKRRNVEIYGVENSGNLPQFIDKRRQTNLDRYGVDNPARLDEFKEKGKQTNLAKYGVPYASQSDEVKAKANASMIARWGVGMPDIVKRRAETCLKRYGVSNPMKLDETIQKIKETQIEKYGVPYSPTSLQGLQSNIAQHKARLKDGAISNINKAFKERLDKVGWDCQFEFEIEGKFYDLWTEGHPILVEIDPTFTHYTDGKQLNNSIAPSPRDRILQKSELAEKWGFHCVHVFDWDDNYKVIQMLRRDRKPIYARKCSIVEIDDQTARDFENVYHLQGAVNSQAVAIGLDYGGELVEIMTFGPPRYNHHYQWELLRLCTHSDYTVVGGASKLFNYFIKTYSPESILSYCDRAKFSGDVYLNIGMTLHHVSDPAKVWSKGNKRITDNLLRKRGYDQLFNTDYGKGTSNEQLMIDNGWHTVYDCGQLVFEWKRENT